MKQPRARPKLPPVSEQMKAWSSALGGEIGGWPQVSTRPFFGLTALYRKDRIFALLPRTRAIRTANRWPSNWNPQQQPFARVSMTIHTYRQLRWGMLAGLPLNSRPRPICTSRWIGSAVAYKAGGKNRKSK